MTSVCRPPPIFDHNDEEIQCTSFFKHPITQLRSRTGQQSLDSFFARVKPEPSDGSDKDVKPELITQWTPLSELKASVVCGDRIGVLKLRSFDVHLPPLSPPPSKNFTTVELLDGGGRVVHLVGKGRMNAILVDHLV